MPGVFPSNFHGFRDARQTGFSKQARSARIAGARIQMSARPATDFSSEIRPLVDYKTASVMLR
jgi:hypothetical protein